MKNERGGRGPGRRERKPDDFVRGTSRPVRNVTVEEVERALFADGKTVADYALLESGLALRKTAEGKWVAAVPADAELARAASRILRQRGARTMTSGEALGGSR